MKYCGTLISVADMEKSKNFYEKVMGQKITMDLGVNVSFENGLALQADYAGLVGIQLETQPRPNTFELYFEVEDLDAWEAKLKATEGIEFIHESKEYPWGQRVLRFYDYDQHIVEISESMETVAKRYLAQGLSIEQTAERTMFPVEFVKQLL